MFKRVAIAAIATMFASSAFAAECTKVEMDKMEMQVKAMTDKPKQDEAMKHMDLAKDTMTKNDLKSCSMHMDAAAKSMNMKM